MGFYSEIFTRPTPDARSFPGRSSQAAGVEVGILRGYHKLSKIRKFDRPKIQRFHNPQPIIQKIPRFFQKCVRFTRIRSCFNIIHNYSKFTQMPSLCFLFLSKTIEIEDCLGTTKNNFRNSYVQHFPTFGFLKC